MTFPPNLIGPIREQMARDGIGDSTPSIKPGWLWEDLKQAAKRAAQLTAEFWRGRQDAAEHGRCAHCGNPIPHRRDF